MKTIAQNEHYAILVDKTKNRLYLTITGFWASPSVVPNYMEDLRKAARELSRDYTVLTDVIHMKTPPLELVPVHAAAQKLLMDAGLRKTAELVSHDAIAKMAIDRFSRESGMEKGTFESKSEAEAWLDRA